MIHKSVKVLSAFCQTRVDLGEGDICLASGGFENEKGSFVSFSQMDKPLPIGAIPDKTVAPSENQWEVMLKFTKEESIDVVITMLQEARVNLKKGENDERS